MVGLGFDKNKIRNSFCIHESKHYLIMTIYGTLWMKREGVGIVNPAEKNVKFQAKDIFDICCMTGHSHCKYKICCEQTNVTLTFIQEQITSIKAMNSLFLHGFFVLFASLELSWGHFSGNFQEIPSQEVLRGGPFWEVGETSSIILNTSISCIMCIVAVLQESFSFRILTMIHVLNNEKIQLLRLRQNSVNLVLSSWKEMLSAEDTRTGTITAMRSELFLTTFMIKLLF